MSVFLLLQFSGVWGTGDTTTQVLMVLVPALGLFSLIPFGGIITSKLAYGSATLILDTKPASPGERFRGTILTNMNAPIRDAIPEGFTVRVSCNRRRNQSTSSRGSGTTRQILWQQELHLESETHESRDGGELTIPISVDLPSGMPTTSLPGMTGETISWRVEVRGTSRRPKFRADFEIPVYDTRSAADREQQAFEVLNSGEQTKLPAHDVAAAIEARGEIDALVATEFDGTFPLRDLVATANQARTEADPRSVITRLHKARRPLDTITRNAEGSVVLIHVRGDRAVRRARRVIGVGALVMMFVAFHRLFFLLMVSAFLMARSARPFAVRVSATPDALDVETVRGRRTTRRQYGWDQIGAVRPFQAGPGAWGLTWVVRRRRSVNPHLAVRNKSVIDALAATIENRRDECRASQSM